MSRLKRHTAGRRIVVIDAGLAPGSYSYVVVTVDARAKALVHSNPVFVQVVAPD